MAHSELDEILELLHWSTRTFAEVVRVDESSARRWRKGQGQTPQPIADWLRKLAKAHRANPPPPPPPPRSVGRPAGGGAYAPRKPSD